MHTLGTLARIGRKLFHLALPFALTFLNALLAQAAFGQDSSSDFDGHWQSQSSGLIAYVEGGEGAVYEPSALGRAASVAVGTSADCRGEIVAIYVYQPCQPLDDR